MIIVRNIMNCRIGYVTAIGMANMTPTIAGLAASTMVLDSAFNNIEMDSLGNEIRPRREILLSESSVFDND